MEVVERGQESWTSPEGKEYFVKYEADENGFRIVESNVVPATDGGMLADGAQGSFVSLEDLFDEFDK
ncbi:putative Insect cuticle protein domain-containing protein 14 [Homarus americanus]|uniref:Putative Insect cuticle protein domain-containing protein 14 n=1 Tax=Homarus americanus TaxID=6706 RepID=A0A8J5N121_HOMAM|nr:putative Insect cuticle protein domain-containing protein 14 [Homarus americanus]